MATKLSFQIEPQVMHNARRRPFFRELAEPPPPGGELNVIRIIRIAHVRCDGTNNKHMYMYIQWGDALVSHDSGTGLGQNWNHSLPRQHSSCPAACLISTPKRLQAEGFPGVLRHLVFLHDQLSLFFA